MNILKWFFNPEWFTFYMGGGGTPTQSTSYTSNIPEYAQPYVEQMLGATQKQVFTQDKSGSPTGFQPFTPYGATVDAQGNVTNSAQEQANAAVAGFSPAQMQSQQGIMNYQLPGQTGAASQLAGTAGMGSLMAGQNYQNTATNPYATQAYMSPYVQNALAPQMEEARRQYDITQSQTGAQAAQQGAFGGARHGIVESENARNLGTLQNQIYGTGMQNAFQSAQQAQQFGANLGMQGYGQALQGAGQLGALGQQQYGQEMGLLDAQGQVGAQQQQLEQQKINQAIQNYATQQQYPLMQLGVMSNMLRGLPMQASTTQMYQNPSAMSQVAGAAGTGLGLYSAYNQAFPSKKEGGEVKAMAKGGIAMAAGGTPPMPSGGIATGVNPQQLPGMLEQLSDQQLVQKMQNPGTDMATKELTQAETGRRAALRARNGGVIAFKDEGEVDLEKAEAANDGVMSEVKPKVADAVAEAQAAAEATPPEPVATAPAPAPRPPESTSVNPNQIELGKFLPQKSDAETRLEATLGEKQGIASTKLEELYRADEEAKKNLGIVSPMDAQNERITKREAQMKEDAKHQFIMRAAQFLTEWGATPGNTAMAMAKAGSRTLERMDIDKAMRQQLQDKLDDAKNKIAESMYAEKMGQLEKARKIKEDAGKDIIEVNKALAPLGADRNKAVFEARAKSTEAEIANNAAMSRTMATLKSEEERARAKNMLELKMKGMEVAKKTDLMNATDVFYKDLVASGAPKNDKTFATALNKAFAGQGLASGKLDVAQQQATAATMTAGATLQDKIEKAVEAESGTKANRTALKDAKAADKAAGISPGDAKSATRKAENAIRSAVEKRFVNPAAAPAPAGPAATTTYPAPAVTPAAPVSRASPPRVSSEALAASAKTAFGSYEPSKYDYRINPQTGTVQRKAK